MEHRSSEQVGALSHPVPELILFSLRLSAWAWPTEGSLTKNAVGENQMLKG